jgi:hypothetical protein
MWELAVPHLPSRLIDFKGLARERFHTSSCSFFYEGLYFQVLLNTRKVRRNYFPHVSCVIWPSPVGVKTPVFMNDLVVAQAASDVESNSLLDFCCSTTFGGASSRDEVSNNLNNINDLKFYH